MDIPLYLYIRVGSMGFHRLARDLFQCAKSALEKVACDGQKEELSQGKKLSSMQFVYTTTIRCHLENPEKLFDSLSLINLFMKKSACVVIS